MQSCGATHPRSSGWSDLLFGLQSSGHVAILSQHTCTSFAIQTGAPGSAGPPGVAGSAGPLGPRGIAGYDKTVSCFETVSNALITRKLKQEPAGPSGTARAARPLGPQEIAGCVKKCQKICCETSKAVRVTRRSKTENRSMRLALLERRGLHTHLLQYWKVCKLWR